MRESMEWDEDIDARGLLCPLPVLKARKRLAGMRPGQILRLRATDPASILDVPHFCAGSGDELLASEEVGADRTFLIRKADGAAADMAPGAGAEVADNARRDDLHNPR